MTNCKDIWFLDNLNKLFLNEDYDFMLYSGLKDKKGQEIYEGDIVYQDFYFEDKLEKIYEEVYYDQGMFKTGKWPLAWNIETYIPSANWQVVGNIYENPNLILNNKNE